MAEQQLANAMLTKFACREDAYAVQLPKGGYVKVEQSLTSVIIQKHLEGVETVGVYQLNQWGMVKWLCFDLDPEKLNDPKSSAQRLLQVCFQKKMEEDEVERPRIWPHSVLLEASRFPDPSYHIWIFFAIPALAKVAQWLGLRILELASLSPKQVEVFPKQGEITKEQPYGNLVKLPFGFHQVERKWSRALDFESFEPLPNNVLLEKWGLTLSEADIAKILSFEDKKHVQATFDLPRGNKPLRGTEEQKAVKFLAKYWRKGQRNQLELAFLGYCLKCGVDYESVRRIIERVCDLTNDEEKASRLKLVDYHYQNRRSLGSKLVAVSGLREIVREALN
ncbi:MAG: TOTE conflict system archaeo-eukaryotic primase domain-containing protein [Candidatus Bathyarchaeales archaeon]